VNTVHRSENSRTKPVRKGLHPKNLHNQGYDFPVLVKSHPPLAPYVKPNAYGELSIDFADPLAVKTLNAALLNRADADSECNTLTGWLMGFHGTWSSARSSLLSDI